METQQTKKIISGDSFSTFVRNANNNQHRTSRGSHKSGEYFVVTVLLEGSHDSFIVPTEITKIEKIHASLVAGCLSMDIESMFLANMTETLKIALLNM